jgi:hypothetical protein
LKEFSESKGVKNPRSSVYISQGTPKFDSREVNDGPLKLRGLLSSLQTKEVDRFEFTQQIPAQSAGEDLLEAQQSEQHSLGRARIDLALGLRQSQASINNMVQLPRSRIMSGNTSEVHRPSCLSDKVSQDFGA